MFKQYFKIIFFIFINSLIFNYSLKVLAIETNLKQENSCPTDLEILTNQLLIDLPDYANRVIQISRRLDREIDLYSTVIVAGKPEFEPLELSNFEYTPFSTEQPEQVFFTTLERSYEKDRIVETQTYHWLFLTRTIQGWQTVMMYSQTGSNSNNSLLSPPWESSNSAIGQGINLWLRDCELNSFSNNFTKISH